MGKNNKKKNRAEEKQAMQQGHHKLRERSTSDYTIEDAFSMNFADLLKMKRHKNDLLDVSLPKNDLRIPIMKRKAQQSPLLRLPAELRNKIALMVVGEQHIHISVCSLPDKPTVRTELPAIEIGVEWSWNLTIPIRCSDDRFRYNSMQRTGSPRINNSYPLDWRAYYASQRTGGNVRIGRLYFMLPENPIVYGFKSKLMNNYPLPCRQVYQVVGLLAYSTNEFSFCSPYALNAWLDARLPVQLSAIQVLWFDIEWQSFASATAHINSPRHPVSLKLSRLMWTSVESADWKDNEDQVHNDLFIDRNKGESVLWKFLDWLNPELHFRWSASMREMVQEW